MKYPHSNVCVLTLAAMLVLGRPAVGQTGPDEHAKHHPQPSTANPAAGVNAAGVDPGGGMGDSSPVHLGPGRLVDRPGYRIGAKDCCVVHSG